MKALAERLDFEKVNYVWSVFTNDEDIIHSPNVIFLQPRLDVYKWIQEADYLVQLSDTEAMSYSINEAMSYGTKVVVTPLPYLQEISISNENAIILDFDCSNIIDVVEKMKNVSRVKWNAPSDDYINILAPSKSNYRLRSENKMKKIKATIKFKDMMHNNVLRYAGEEFIEEEARANDLINRGFATLIADIKEEAIEVEQAVKKEVKKEKAVKEKAIKPATKETKKNAKK